MRKIMIYFWATCGVIMSLLFVMRDNVRAESMECEVDCVVVSSDNDLVKLPEVYIKMVNPGYTIDGVGNVGEAIEIGRRRSDEMISLAGLTVGYTNSSGNMATLVEFPENSYMVGETILLRLASSPGHELAALNYAKTLAFKAGPLVLMRDGEVIDSVCWDGKEGCAKEFKSASPTVLVRNVETGEFGHMAVDDYEVKYDNADYYVEEKDDEGYGKASQCAGVIFSEILSYYEETQAEQFVEVYNTTSEQVLLDGCALKYKNKTYPLTGILKAEEYVARYLTDFAVTKNPTNVGVLELADVDGAVVARLEYPGGQRKGTAWALIGYDADGGETWRTTYAPTPGEANNYQEFRTCEVGKVINEVTGNCVKVTEVVEKVCTDGQYLNPLTGRCKKIEEVASVTICKEGYYLNEETGRCRKIVENKGADYSLVTEVYEEKSSFVALYAVVGVVALGVIYTGWQFRHELRRLCGKVFRRFR